MAAPSVPDSPARPARRRWRLLGYWLVVALLPIVSHRAVAQTAAATLTFAPVADTYVDGGATTSMFGTAATLQADGSPIRIIYLRFTVSGVGTRPVQTARLRLGVKSGSPAGGTVHRITNNTWNETTLNFNTRPAIDGPGLSTLGAVTTGATVEFDLGTAIPGDGTYSLAIDTTNTSSVTYNSSSATTGQKPALVLAVGAAPSPTVTIIQPRDGSTFFAGDQVLLQGTARDGAGTDLSSRLAWRSSVAGPLGTGALLGTSALGIGTHAITASVTDANGLTGSSQVGVVVEAPPPGNTEPLVTITAPTGARTLVAGVPLVFTAGAHDLEDGDLSAGLAWSSDRDGMLGTGGSFARPLSAGPHRVTASVTDRGGLGGSATIDVTVEPGVALEFPAIADASVDAAQPGTALGTAPMLVGGASPERIVYLRFSVTGLRSRPIGAAVLRLQVDAQNGAGSVSAGQLFAITDHAWQEASVTYGSRPALDGPLLGTLGAVSAGQRVAIDATPGVDGDAIYDFALETASPDAAIYDARESGTPPTLVVVVPGHPPSVSITAPPPGSVYFEQAPILLRGSATDVEDGDVSDGIEWRSSLDGALASGAAITTRALRVGTHVVTARATDADGQEAEAQLSLRVRAANLAPVVQITGPADGGSVPAGTGLALAATASDDEDGNVSGQVRWGSDRDGALGPNGTRILSEGAHILTAAATDSDGATGSARVHVTVTPTAPVVTLTAPADGTTAFVGTPVSFSGSATDATDGDLTAALQWSSDRDGVLGTGGTLARSGLSVGTHLVTAAATDRGGLVGRAHRTVVIRPPNVPPVVSIATPAAGSSVLGAAPVLLAANATDAEDGELTPGVHWSSSRDGNLGTGGALVVPSLSLGTHVLSVSATDRDGATTTATINLTVTPATLLLPAIADTYVDAANPKSKFGTAATLFADNSPVKQVLLRFGVSGVGALGVQQALLRLTVNGASAAASNRGGEVRTISDTTWSEAATIYNTRPPLDGAVLASRASAVAVNAVVDFDVTAGVRGDGSYNFALTTTSSDEVIYNSREASKGQPQLVLTLTQNQAPVVRITAPADGMHAVPGAPVTLTGTALDAESGNLSSQIQWSSSLDGPLGTGGAVTLTTLRSGTHTITARATDAGNRSAEARLTLVVLHRPTIRITAPADGTVVFATQLPLTFGASATDVEDGILSGRIQWRSDRDGPLAAGATISASALSVGAHVITASVIDDDGLGTQAQIGIRVRAANVAPRVTITAPADGTEAPAGTPIALVAGALDDFDGDVSARIQWTATPGGPLGTGASRSVTLAEGGHAVTASVTDTDGAVGTATVQVRILPTPPTVTITAPAAGGHGFVGSSVAFSGTALDATDGDISPRLRWMSSRDGLLGIGAGFATSALSVGTHTITAEAIDTGGLVGRAQQTFVVRSPNVAPSLSILTPAAGSGLLAGKPVLLSAVARDAEDGEVSAAVRWSSSRDGSLGTGATVLVSALSAGSHVLSAAVTDADGAASSATAAVTVSPGVLSFAATADTYVDSANATSKFGTATSLFADNSPVKQAFLRFAVSGIGPFTVQQAVLRLTATAASNATSPVGGTVSTITNTTWSEASTTYNTRPRVDGTALATHGAVTLRQIVDFNLTAAVHGDATYNFALTSSSSDDVIYASREATSGQPQLIVTLAQNQAPAVRITAPAPGTVVDVGAPLTLAATASDAESGDLGAAITWTSSRDGMLGRGGSLTLASLSAGTHTLTASVTDAGGRTASATIMVAIDASPTVGIASPATGTVAEPGASIGFTATALDPEDGSLTASIAWRSDRDGGLGTGGTITTSTLSPGAHTVTATVADRRGKSASAMVRVLIDAVPAVRIAAPASGAMFEPGAITFSATATDAESGDVTSAIAWRSDRDGALGTGGTLTTTALHAGTHTITASAGDATGRSGQATILVTINAKPTVTIDTAAPDIELGAPLTLRAHALDPEDGDLSAAIVWTSSRDGALGTGGSVTARTLTSGIHTISATVTDRGGTTGSTTVTVTVNATPTVRVVAPADGAVVEPGTPVTLRATASDAEDGDLGAAVRWSSSRDGALGTGDTLTAGSLTTGTHTLSAAVTDHGGKSATATVVIIIDAAPHVTIASPASDATFEPGETITLTGIATDAEEGDLSGRIAWRSSRDGALGSGPSLPVRTLTSGTHRLTASTSDHDGKSGEATVTITVNATPAVTLGAVTPGTDVEPGVAIRLTATASDTEDGDLTPALVWTSDRDGTLGNGGSLTAAALSAGVHTVTAAATDQGGKTGRATLTIIVNASPTLRITDPAERTVFEPGVPITLAASAMDAEDGDLAPDVQWSFATGAVLGTGSPITVGSPGPGTHTITASVMDRGGRLTTAAVTVVVDALPQVAIAAPASGASFEPDETITLTGSANDAEDGDLDATIAWRSSRDGALGTGATLAVGTLSSGLHDISAAVADHTGRRVESTIRVVVDATPSLAIDLPLPGAEIQPGDLLACAATATDAEDGDLTSAIVWASDRAGALGRGGAITTMALGSGLHTITATVTDAGGKMRSATRTVSVNASPSLHIIAPPTGTSPEPGTPLTLSAIATDLEDGDLTAAVAWSSNLTGPLGGGSPLLTSPLASGTHTITAAITDSGGRTAHADILVVVNATPTLRITAPADGTVAAPGELLHLLATASDREDGDLAASIAWSSNRDGALGAGSPLDAALLRSGTHVITASVRDHGGKTASVTTTVEVNAAPHVTIAQPGDGSVFSPGDAISLQGSASDLEDGSLTTRIVWSSDRDGALGSGGSLSVATLSSGVHTIAATIADQGGKRDVAHVTLLVNAAPSIAVTAPTDGSVIASGETVALGATAGDREDGDLGSFVSWTSSLDGALGTGSTLSVSTLRHGAHTLRASVTDRGGKNALAEVHLLVDTAPTLAITAPADGSTFAFGETASLQASAADVEDGDLGASIVWTSNLDGLLGGGAARGVATLRSGTHTITAAVTDADGRRATATRTLVVAPLITLQGTYTSFYNVFDLDLKTRIDAHLATFLAGPSNLYPLSVGGDSGVVLGGPTVRGQYDRSWSWDQMHDLNNAGVAFANTGFTLDGARIDNVTDAIRPRAGGAFTIRNVWATYVRDDCIENDHLQDGVIEDSLFDGCFEGISARPSPAIIDSGYDGRGKVVTIRNTLLRLQPMPGPRSASADNLGHVGFFKWHNWDSPQTSLSPKLALHDNVFMAERAGQVTGDRMGIPPQQLASCSNNVMVWLGSGPFPATLPSCFTITTNRAVWDNAVASWIARHPNLVR